MPRPTIELLSQVQLESIHEASLEILRDAGVIVHHHEVLAHLAEAGANVDIHRKIVHFPEEMVNRALQTAGRKYVLHGRDGTQVARFGLGDQNLMSSPGQFAWFDTRTGIRRDPTTQDARDAIAVADALPNIKIVGAMAVPVDVPLGIRDVVLTRELVRGTCKPTRCWPVTKRSSRYVLEIYSALAGGKKALAERPMVEVFLEPISPLQLPETGLDIMLEYLEYGQPVSIGPMVMASGTGPATLAGTLALENAEILSGIVVVQTLKPGTPVLYGGIPHIMDPRTSICAFGSPEQGLMAVAMAQVARFYGFPVYVNVGLTDAKTLDVQAGMEKMGSYILGALVGADLFGHSGLVGTDHGASLPWLVVDDEAMTYARRVARGFEVNMETLAVSIVAQVGPAGNYLFHDHTLAHYRDELLVPNKIWTRETYDGWQTQEATSMGERAQVRVDEILNSYERPPIDPSLVVEIDKIVEAARLELA